MEKSDFHQDAGHVLDFRVGGEHAGVREALYAEPAFGRRVADEPVESGKHVAFHL